MNTFTVAEALADIEIALSKVVWRKCREQPEMALASAYEGDANGWRFTIITWKSGIDFSLRTECDGTAMKGGLVMRLTPELAKKAGELAEAQRGIGK